MRRTVRRLIESPAAEPRQPAGFERRAASLPPAMRRRYASEVYAKLPRGCRGLLITLEYPQAEMDGPPFAVPEDEVDALFAPAWDVELVERRDILANEPRFIADGVSALSTAVYRLRKR